jgi:anti-sigma factor RsiW
MNNHLTDDQLNEILDAPALSEVEGSPVPRPPSSVARHLDTCADCRARLADLRAVFTALESLPEVNPPRDLTQAILARLPQRQTSPAWKWLFAAQALGALAIAASLASSFAMPLEIATYQPPTFDSLLASVVGFLSTTSLKTPSFTIPTFNLEFSTFNLTVFIVSAALLWLVGNGFLLRGATSRSRK